MSTHKEHYIRLIQIVADDGSLIMQPVDIQGDATLQDLWYVTDRKDNAIATCTKAAEAGKKHFIVAVIAGYSDVSVEKLITVKDGATEIMYGKTSIPITPAKPLKGTSGNLVSASIPASGAAGTIGIVTMIGFTE